MLHAKEFESYKLRENILEEVAACILGGYGIPAEMGLVAFDRLKNENLIKPGVKYPSNLVPLGPWVNLLLVIYLKITEKFLELGASILIS